MKLAYFWVGACGPGPSSWPSIPFIAANNQKKGVGKGVAAGAFRASRGRKGFLLWLSLESRHIELERLVCALSPSWTLAHELISAVMDGPTVEQLRNAVREAEGEVLACDPTPDQLRAEAAEAERLAAETGGASVKTRRAVLSLKTKWELFIDVHGITKLWQDQRKSAREGPVEGGTRRSGSRRERPATVLKKARGPLRVVATSLI